VHREQLVHTRTYTKPAKVQQSKANALANILCGLLTVAKVA
jgi:hypothetical protein